MIYVPIITHVLSHFSRVFAHLVTQVNPMLRNISRGRLEARFHLNALTIRYLLVFVDLSQDGLQPPPPNLKGYGHL